MKTITESAIIADADGYNQQYGVAICDHEDSISVGATEHSKSDLVIDLDRKTITSVIAGWTASWA